MRGEIMYWYTAWYGSWNDKGGVRYLDGTYDRKDIFNRAQKIANETGKVVTVRKRVPTGCGLRDELQEVCPQ